MIEIRFYLEMKLSRRLESYKDRLQGEEGEANNTFRTNKNLVIL